MVGFSPFLFVLLVGLVLGTWRIGLRLARHTQASAKFEWAVLAVVQVVALALFWPYTTSGLLGSGDMYHYALQAADFRAQIRSGVFPVFVGQSEFAFNGNVHTIRTAPYHVHFAGILDLLTIGRLSSAQLVNAEILLTAVASAAVVCVATRRLAPSQPWAAVVLPILYVGSPAFWLPVAKLDMLATFLALPWLPVFWLGLALYLKQGDDARSPVAATAALAAVWYAHPPTAVWLTAFFLAALIIGCATSGPRFLTKASEAVLACVLLGGLVAYVIVSERELQLETIADTTAIVSPESVMANLRLAWPDALLPLREVPGRLGELQLGYALLSILLLALVRLPWTGRPGAFLCLSVFGLAALLVPSEGARMLWTAVPEKVRDVTNVWPMQRFYPILAGLAVVWGALAASTLPLGRASNLRWPAAIAIGLLAWTGWECRVFFARMKDLAPTARIQAKAMESENARLTRSSYLLFNHFPSYFTHGYTDPAFELRLIDRAGVVQLDNLLAGWSQQAGAPDVAHDLRRPLRLESGPETAHLLQFEFADLSPGEVKISSRTLERIYPLPSGGGTRAFGSAAGSTRILPVARPPNTPTEVVEVSCVGPSATVTTRRFDPLQLPLRLVSHTPLHVKVVTPTAGFLETPRVFIPGYEARVNGRTEAPRRSPEKLVAVPVPAGESDVELAYVGTPRLRLAFGVSVMSLATLGFVACSPLAWRSRVNRRFARPAAAGAVVMFGLGIVYLLAKPAPVQIGDPGLQMKIRLPLAAPGQSEPLLVTGRTGAADVVSVIYGSDDVRLSLDHWGVGGPTSDAFPAPINDLHTLEISSPAIRGEPGPGRWVVRWNGKTVLDAELPAHRPEPGELFVGQNPVGASTAGPRFSGEITAISVWDPGLQQ